LIEAVIFNTPGTWSAISANVPSGGVITLPAGNYLVEFHISCQAIGGTNSQNSLQAYIKKWGSNAYLAASPTAYYNSAFPDHRIATTVTWMANLTSDTQIYFTAKGGYGDAYYGGAIPIDTTTTFPPSSGVSVPGAGTYVNVMKLN